MENGKIPEDVLKRAWMAGSRVTRREIKKRELGLDTSNWRTMEECWKDKPYERDGMEAAAKVILKWAQKEKRK